MKHAERPYCIFKVESINSALKNDMFYCNDLPFGIIPRSFFLNTETMNIISSYNEDEIALFEIACEKYHEELIFSY